jgi:phosphoadenosine phosphosulfate reductase
MLQETDRLAPFTGLEGNALISALWSRFGVRLALVSSFGAEAAVLLHMAAGVDRSIPVLFVDTGKHFWQTRYYRARLVDLLGLTDVRIISPDARQLAAADPSNALSASDPDACCHVRKVAPLEKALTGFEAVLSGRKRHHGAGREAIAAVSLDHAGRIKAEPLASFAATSVAAYFQQHRLPPHPLAEHGFRSIGCMDCTARGGTAEDPRAGRWAATPKMECGIHIGPNGRLSRTSA